MMKNCFCTRLLLTIILAGLPEIANQSFAQAPYDLSIVLPENISRIQNSTDMVSALSILQKCTDHSFIIEGSPYSQSPNVLRNIKIPKNTIIRADYLIHEIANAYDYTIIQRDKSYILFKKFTNPEDFPSVTTEEFKHFLKNVAIITKKFSAEIAYSPGVNHKFRQFAESLSSEDMTAFNFGESTIAPKEVQSLPVIGHLFKPVEGAILVESPEEFEKIQSKMLRFSQLQPYQQSFFKSIAFSEMCGKPIREVIHGLSLMQELEMADTYFRWGKIRSFDCFTCFRKVSPEKTYKTPWSPSDPIQWNFGSAALLKMGSIQGEIDSDKPKVSDYDSEGKPLPRREEIKDTITLRRLADILNSKNKSGISYSVNARIDTKTISFIDSGKTSVKSILDAVLEIYNLRLKEEKDKITITVPEVQISETWEQASLQVENIFPGPLLRFCQVTEVNVNKREIAKMRQEMIKNSIPDAQTRLIDRDKSRDLLLGIDTIRRKMIARLRVQLEPRTKAAKDQTLPWKELTEEEKRWTSFVFACEAIPFAYKLANSSLPSYISHPENCIVSGRIFESQGRKFLRVAIRTADGQEGVSSTALIEDVKK